MEYLISALIGIVLFETYLLYEKRTKKAEKQIDKREKEEQERREQHIQALLNYDVDTAYKGGKR